MASFSSILQGVYCTVCPWVYTVMPAWALPGDRFKWFHTVSPTIVMLFSDFFQLYPYNFSSVISESFEQF